MTSKPFFVTTPIYYANGSPHIGHAYTTLAADVAARFRRMAGTEVVFSTGTDEHGLKIEEKAREAGSDPQAFVDGIASEFRALWERLDISHTRFIRTTEAAHKAAVEKVLQTLYDQGAIYKGEYEGLYCVGCEQFKTEDELVDGKCPDHDRVPERVREEAYLLKMAELQSELVRRIEAGELRIETEQYRTEMLSFLTKGTLHDISISRKNVKWGVPLPFDPEHTAYVWVDAFLNYLTVLGWRGEGPAPAAWPADVQFIGKDILRVHATVWQVMLMHLDFPTTQLLFTHGHILSGGKKMSKTLGNVIAIGDMLERFGTDGTRYLLLSAGRFGDDVDLTLERMTEKYNADLANGLGNLVSRVVKLGESAGMEPLPLKASAEAEGTWSGLLEAQALSEALGAVWALVRDANKHIDEEKPWELAKSDAVRFKMVMEELFVRIAEIGYLLQPFLPETAHKIEAALQTGKTEAIFKRL